MKFSKFLLLINCFWKIRVVLRRTFNCFYSSGPEKDRLLASAVVLLLRLFDAADVLVVQWWLEERWCVGVGQVVKMDVVC